MTERDATPAPAPKKGLFSRKKAEEPPQDAELDGLMAEIESDIREDELKRIWRQYGATLITIAVLFLGGVAGYEGWRAYEARQHAAAAEAYNAAVTTAADRQLDDAQAQLAELAAGDDQPYAALARLTEAGVRLQNNDVDGAVAAYAALASDPNVDPLFRDMATILKVLNSLDRADAKALESEVAPLRTGSVFRHSATEISALLAAKQGDTTRAAELAQSLVEAADAPQGVRARAQDLAAMYKAGILPADLPPPPPPLPASSVMDLVAPAAEAEPAAPSKP